MSPSRRTTQLWRTTANPTFYLLACFIATTIALILVLSFGLVEGGAKNVDRGSAILILLMPWAGIAFIWTAVDLVVCHYAALHPVEAIVAGSIIVLGYIISSVLGLAAWSYRRGPVDWLPPMWELLCVIPYAMYLYAGVGALRAGRKSAKAEARVRGLQSELA